VDIFVGLVVGRLDEVVGLLVVLFGRGAFCGVVGVLEWVVREGVKGRENLGFESLILASISLA